MVAEALPLGFTRDELEACVLSRERGMLNEMVRLTGADLGTVKDYVQSVNISVAQALKEYLAKQYPNYPRLTIWLAALKAAMKAGFGFFRCLVKKALEGDKEAAALLTPSPENAAKVAYMVAKYALPIVMRDLGEYNGIKYPETVPEEVARKAAELAKTKNLHARKRPA